MIEQIKRSVALGILASGEQLPTVKQLALDLTINPNTVAKAYRELERDGVIETSPGRGSFVKSNGSADTTKTAATDIARDAIDVAVREAKSIGLKADEIRTLANTAVDRWFREN
ncbi:MAG TPA: GntR family transcriptional regulator [Candidatus Baltobacteraceae bacterium]|nr:GntR family transcriptional regulator [Candidatus Baltobacteraceae bacterium]